jgi:GH43 family beta-xylosidase
MKINKRILFSSVLGLVLSLGVVGCGPTGDPTSEPTLPPEPFVNDCESTLEADVDYVEHSQTYSGGDYEYDKSKWYVNDLTEVPLPDPHIYVENDTYYITGTSDRSNGKEIDIYSTKDFNTFKFEGAVYNPVTAKSNWEGAAPYIYAPEIYKFDGTYYMYYSASDANGRRWNSVVQSDNILGPYEPIVNDVVDGRNNPVFQNGIYSVLDATIFVDDDGKMYMYYAVSGSDCQYSVGVELISPYEADWSTLKTLVKPGHLSSENQAEFLTWENPRYYPIAEAPYMLKSNGKYYLTYSVNGCWNKFYMVCYAVSDSPLGNFEKPYYKNAFWSNLLIGYPGTTLNTSTVWKQWSGFASGVGHHCFFNIGNQTMIAYHAHQNRDHNSEDQYTQRYFGFDYVHFDSDGTPFVNGPTWSPQPLPEAISTYKNIATTATVRTENVTNEAAITDNYIVDCYNLPQEKGKEVELGSGYSYIELTFDKEYEIGGFAIYNSAYFDNAICDVKYANFGNGNAVKDMTFLENKFMSYGKEFIFPNSAFTVEFNKTFTSNKLTICFDLSYGGQINEIVVLGK